MMQDFLRDGDVPLGVPNDDICVRADRNRPLAR